MCGTQKTIAQMKSLWDNIIVPFVIKKRKELKLEETHPATAIFDNFRGQTTAAVLSYLRSHNIIPIQLLENYTDKFQQLDISVNKPMKDHLKAMVCPRNKEAAWDSYT